MPASYTHQCFGNLVLENLNDKEIKNTIDKNINYYNIGLQGPDILFFYRPLKKNSISALGSKLHEDIAREFFENALTILKSNYDKRALAYILGFINHFILDSTCHGYINKTMKDKNISHFEIERDLEQRFMIINHDEFNFCVPKHYTINLEVAKVIAPFFKLEAKDIFIALKSFRRFNQLFACKNKIKRNFVLTAIKIVNAKKYQGMIIREIPEKRIEKNIDVLVNQFIQATNIAVKEIVGYCYSLKNNTGISKRFNCNYE